jgi:hypothetical protein
MHKWREVSVIKMIGPMVKRGDSPSVASQSSTLGINSLEEADRGVADPSVVGDKVLSEHEDYATQRRAKDGRYGTYAYVVVPPFGTWTVVVTDVVAGAETEVVDAADEVATDDVVVGVAGAVQGDSAVDRRAVMGHWSTLLPGEARTVLDWVQLRRSHLAMEGK